MPETWIRGIVINNVAEVSRCPIPKVCGGKSSNHRKFITGLYLLNARYVKNGLESCVERKPMLRGFLIPFNTDF
jgi:hypothetical protein